MTTSGISPTGYGDNSQSTTPPVNKDLGSKEVFLQLLVSQIKNQDPLNPMDSINFVTQLAQFSQLEATLGMRKDLQTVVEQALPSD